MSRMIRGNRRSVQRSHPYSRMVPVRSFAMITEPTDRQISNSIGAMFSQNGPNPSNFNRNRGRGQSRGRGNGGRGNGRNSLDQPAPPNADQSPRQCLFCGYRGHNVEDCRHINRCRQQWTNNKDHRPCNHCGDSGHIRRSCTLYIAAKERLNGQEPVMVNQEFVANVQPSSGIVQPSSDIVQPSPSITQPSSGVGQQTPSNVGQQPSVDIFKPRDRLELADRRPISAPSATAPTITPVTSTLISSPLISSPPISSPPITPVPVIDANTPSSSSNASTGEQTPGMNSAYQTTVFGDNPPPKGQRQKKGQNGSMGE